MLQENWEKEYHYAGGFQCALMRAIEQADRVNLDKLSNEYPELVLSYRKFTEKQ